MPTAWLVRQARRLSVRRRLALTFAVVTILPLFVTTGILAGISTDSTRATLQAQAEGSIGQVADSVSAQLAALQRSAVKLSYREPLQRLLTVDDDPTPALLDEAHASAVDEFALTDYVVAVQISASGASWLPVLGDDPAILAHAERDTQSALRTIKEQGGRSVYLAFGERSEATDTDSGSRTGYIQQWRQVYDRLTKQPIGYLVITVREAYLSSIVNRVSEVHGSRAIILAEHNNQVISNVGPGLMRTGDTPASSVRLLDTTASGGEAELEGKRYAVAAAAVSNTDLSAVLLTPSDYLYTAQNAVLRAFFAIAGVAAVVALLVAAVMARSVNQPIGRLTRKIATLEEAPEAALVADEGSDELAVLDRRFNQLVAQNREHARARHLDILERHRMELKVLQAQINPHFVANALGSIRELARLGNSRAVAELSDALARMINRTFRSREDWTTLRDEFQSAVDYGVVASYRQAGDVVISTQLPDELAGCVVPQFILQPLVENAYVHGFDSSRGGRIHLRAELDESGMVHIEVRDNGAGIEMADAADASGSLRGGLGMTRFGLRSVRERLRLMYEEQAGMTILSEPWMFTAVQITVPLRGVSA